MKRGYGNKALPLAGKFLAVDSCSENPFPLSVGPGKSTALLWRDTSKDTQASKLDLVGEKNKEDKIVNEWRTEVDLRGVGEYYQNPSWETPRKLIKKENHIKVFFVLKIVFTDAKIRSEKFK